jgi:hypothetical protein
MIAEEIHLVGVDRAKLEAAVAAHPFLIGVSAHHVRLLADCAMRSKFAPARLSFEKVKPRTAFI